MSKLLFSVGPLMNVKEVLRSLCWLLLPPRKEKPCIYFIDNIIRRCKTNTMILTIYMTPLTTAIPTANQDVEPLSSRHYKLKIKLLQ